MLCLRFAMSQKIFPTNSLPTPLTLKPNFGPVSVKTIAGSYPQDGKQKFSKENEIKLGKVQQGFLVASGLFSLGPIDDATVSACTFTSASTGRTGGGLGGHHFSSSSRSHPTKRIIIPKKSRNTFNVGPTGRPLKGRAIIGIGIGVPLFGSSGWCPSFLSLHGNDAFDGFGAGINLKATMFFMFLGAVVAILRKYLMPRLKFRDEDDYLR